MELIYKHKKWDKQLRASEKVWNQSGGLDAWTINDLKYYMADWRIKQGTEKDYQRFYSCYSLTYQLAAEDYYLKDTKDARSLIYTYISGRAALLERMFAVLCIREGKEIYEEEEGDSLDTFNQGIYQMIALGQPLPKCIQNINNVYVHLLNGNVQEAERILDSQEDGEEPEDLFGTIIVEQERMDIQAIIKRDEKALKNQLIERIKEDRKEPIDYFRIIDYYSTAFIKLAYRYGMNIDIDVIEIPKQFLNDEGAHIGKAEAKVPLFDEAVSVLKEKGIVFE